MISYCYYIRKGENTRERVLEDFSKIVKKAEEKTKKKYIKKSVEVLVKTYLKMNSIFHKIKTAENESAVLKHEFFKILDQQSFLFYLAEVSNIHNFSVQLKNQYQIHNYK